MEQIKPKISGIDPLLQNNPQTVDPFNEYAEAMKVITAKGSKKTREDLIELRRLEMRSKVYFDDEIGVYIPPAWVIASLAKVAFAKERIPKAQIRAAVFIDERELKLNYKNEKKVKTADDIAGNNEFMKLLLLKQGMVKVAKAAPIFHDWSFQCTIDFDPTIIDKSAIKRLLSHAVLYGGFGDLRPTFGRATVKFL